MRRNFLNSIGIKGFKSIRELENFPLRSLNVLIGANGSGKSNFISTFRLLNQVIDRKLQLFVGQQGGAERLLHFGQKKTSQIEINLTFGDKDYQAVFVPAVGDTLVFGDETIVYRKSGNRYQLGKGQRETRMYEEYGEKAAQTVADFMIDAMQSWRIYHFHDTSAAAKVKQKGSMNDNELLRADASNLAAFLYRLRETKPEYYHKIVSTIRLAAPFFEDFNLRPDPLKPDTIQLEWREVGSDAYFDAHMLSDGTLRFICLSALLLQPDLPASILIDEPELGLHPYALTLLASLLRSASLSTQVIVSTQSVSLVNQFDLEDIVVVDRDDHQSTFKRLDEQGLAGWLENYDLGDLWEKNVFGGRPK